VEQSPSKLIPIPIDVVHERLVGRQYSCVDVDVATVLDPPCTMQGGLYTTVHYKLTNRTSQMHAIGPLSHSRSQLGSELECMCKVQQYFQTMLERGRYA
jgi:hypothetical protein